jgi:hypothetical protein
MELNAQAVAEATDTPSFRQVTTLKGGNLEVRRSAVTETVSPGGVVDVELTTANSAYVIGPLDDDICFEDTAGYRYDVEVNPDWTDPESFTICHLMPGPLELLRPIEEVFEADFPAPSDEGTYQVFITVRLPGSGEERIITEEVVVSEGGGERPGTPKDPTEGALSLSPAVIAAVILASLVVILLLTM